MQHRKACCNVKSFCGHSLYHGVLLVGTTTIVLATITFLAVVIALTSLVNNDTHYFNRNPVKAMHLIFCMVASGISFYQIIVSSLLLYQALKLGGNIFLCSLWFTSHLSVLTLYCILFLATTIVSFFNAEYLNAVAALIIGIVYEGTYLYFCVVVNSYIHSIDRPTYY